MSFSHFAVESKESLPKQGGMEGLFFSLLQVAIGNRNELTSRPSDEEWALLYDMAKRQALVGIAFKGCERLPKEQRPPMKLFLKWSGAAIRLKERNERLNRECVEVTEELRRAGLHSVVLKGQGNCGNYGCSGFHGVSRVQEVSSSLGDYRTPGDIDVWAWADEGGIKRVIEFAKQHRLDHGLTPMPWHRIVYYHAESALDSGTEVEIHYRPSYLNSFWRNFFLQRWFQKVSRVQGVPVWASPLRFPIPDNGFNAVYQLLHIYKHLFEEGIGLRQILDYYFVIAPLVPPKGLPPSIPPKGLPPSIPPKGGGLTAGFDKEEIMRMLSSFGMRKFVGAMMFVLQRVFAMDDEHLLCEPDEKEGLFLLNEILMAGNFGKYDERISHEGGKVKHAWEKLKHNFRLIGHYPEEVLWEPVFRVYHFCWRALRLWKLE